MAKLFNLLNIVKLATGDCKGTFIGREKTFYMNSIPMALFSYVYKDQDFFKQAHEIRWE